MSIVKSQSLSKNKKLKSKDERIVHRLTKTVLMKFRPEKLGEDLSGSGLMGSIRSLGKFFPFRSSRQTEAASEGSKIVEENPFEKLRFLTVLDGDSYLIGNKSHVDAFTISMLQDYIEVDHLWTLKIKNPILHLIVDPKRRVIVAISSGEIHIFSYEGRKSKYPPVLLKSFKITEEVKFIQFVKDMLLGVFFEKRMHFYAIDGPSSRQISKKDYKVDPEYSLHQAAQCVDGILNLFFVGPVGTNNGKGEEDKNNFGLYCLPVELVNFDLGAFKHTYDISEEFRTTLKVESVDKECFLLNLGREIMMFKRGYLVDQVTINFQVNNTFVKYFPDRKAVHVSPSQIDFYNVLIDLAVNPPKISLKSTDSLVTEERASNYEFMNVLRFQQNKWGVFYQIPSPNLNGEVKYEFSLTIQWDFEKKVSSLLPKVSEFKGEKTRENPQFEKLLERIKQRYDMVSKMGVSRKQAYLWIWRQSSKETIEQFNLLLDTNDYSTIREQITSKLKHKMMQWGEVHKMEQGCLNMLSQNLFSQSDYCEQGFKNFLISHMLVRKLQLFKEIKLYEKESGKIKAGDLAREGDKLMINIQEYTNTLQMDVKAHLLELVYNFCKFKKDVLKEIRMIIRKFKFSFRHVYLTILKEIVSTAKDELLYLLKCMPQLLPYEPTKNDNYDITLLYGVYGEFKDEDWDRALTFGQVMTVFNRQMVMNFKNSMWIRRNWLSYHDMIFLTRTQIEEQFAQDKQKVFYCFIEQIFEQNLGLEGKQQEIVNFLQDQYREFPDHLYNNVPLYRKLYLYFQENKFMHYSFQNFLTKKDHEIFKQIFDHEKFKKGSLLKQIKPIYEDLGQSEKFNYGLLKFFSSDLSQVSDIKYLLNRINNEKRQFHAQNEEMYEVLIKGMQIKLILGSDRDIPIEEVLIYLTKIPLKEGNVLEEEMRVLKEINKLASEFKKMKLGMSVFEMIRNRDAVLMKAIKHEIDTEKINQLQDIQVIAKATQSYLEYLSIIRKNIYGSFQDNDLLFMYLVILLEKVQMTFCVPRLIKDNATLPFGINQIESVVYYCYKKKTTEKPKYSENQHYLMKIIELLPGDNTLRMFIESEVKLVHVFSEASLELVYPISGSSGVISKGDIYSLMDILTVQGLRALDLAKIQQNVSKMQNLLNQSPTPLTLYDLHEKMVTCLLKKGLLNEALTHIESLIALEPQNEGNIIYPLLVFRRISCEFVQQNKTLMLNLISKMFFMPGELLKVFQQLILSELSNEQQKETLINLAFGVLSSSESYFDPSNMLFDETVKQYLKQNPQISNEFQKLLRYQLTHIIKSNEEFSKSIDLPIFHMFILQRPLLFINYLSKAKYSINIRQIRCFLSYLSKYQIFDQRTVLEYSKRLFKTLYQSQRDSIEVSALIESAFSTPLTESVNIDTLPADTENLSRLSKAVEKFKAKLKSRMSSSLMLKKQKSSDIKSSVPPKYILLEESLKDNSKYAITYDYPFNDSDGYIEKIELLMPLSYIQPSSNGPLFLYRKYIRWLLVRSNQTIEHYLIKVHENEADEEMKKIQEALKMSFRRSPYDKTARDLDKPLVKVFGHAQALGLEEGGKEVAVTEMLNLPHISNIPNVQSSAISQGFEEANWLEEVAEVDMAPSILKDSILATLEIPEDGKVTFKIDLLRNYGVGHELDRVLPETIREIYNDEKIDYPTAILLIRQISSFFPKLTLISQSYLEIYSKIDQLQRKLSLDLPVRALLPFQGLKIKEKDNYALFVFLKDKIDGQLDENNVHTLSRIISLAFKKPEYQQEINNGFLKKEIKELDSVEEGSLDERMKIEKIVAFAQKMPVALMKIQIEKMMVALSGSEQKRTKVVKEMSNLLRQKNDFKGAEQLQSKWLSAEQQ